MSTAEKPTRPTAEAVRTADGTLLRVALTLPGVAVVDLSAGDAIELVHSLAQELHYHLVVFRPTEPALPRAFGSVPVDSFFHFTDSAPHIRRLTWRKVSDTEYVAGPGNPVTTQHRLIPHPSIPVEVVTGGVDAG